ncbi:hypothetical protein PoB_005508800, partial [Plakobranchus ocellatus]
ADAQGMPDITLALSLSTHFIGGVGGTVASESALRSAGTLLSRVRAPPTAPWPDGGPESLRSPCCGLAIYKNSTHSFRSLVLQDDIFQVKNSSTYQTKIMIKCYKL